MNLQAIMGRNQQGICFVSKSVSFSDYVTISSKHQIVISEIRKSEKVPEGSIVIDSRLWFSLDISQDKLVSVKNHEAVPKIHTLTLIATSVNPEIPHHEVVEEMRNRIDDFKDDLHGLVVRVGQKIPVPRVDVEITISEIAPISSDGYAQIDWDNVFKFVISPGSVCPPFNLSCVIDCGASSHKKDIFQVIDGVSNLVSRFDAVTTLIVNLLETILIQKDSHLLSMICFSSHLDIMHTFDSITGAETAVSSIESPDIIEIVKEWFYEKLEVHRTEPSNPCIGLEKGIDLAKIQHKMNNHPTIVLFFSSGSYSEGRNPVFCSQTNHNRISVCTIGIGEHADQELLQGIAESGKGVHQDYVNLEQIPKIISKIKEFISGI
ncbi:MAG: VWA domain-containing protein [Candidatus Lokiarchaeota archaeon]|nr:VWA domain-containing protein [Candidatus Lokiarchaeota archaeon]